MVLTTCWNLRVSAEANQGGRRYMEDVTAVQFERKNSLEFASFAIFDGHGGREASHFAKVFSKIFWSFWFSKVLILTLTFIGFSYEVHQARERIFLVSVRCRNGTKSVKPNIFNLVIKNYYYLNLNLDAIPDKSKKPFDKDSSLVIMLCGKNYVSTET